ncbi:hypothetical protein ACFSHT_15690 [Paraburkholderia silviterrae]|uniref:Uncharacterized protein n=1 Tax=Paraburkholderia silviterrae TaxID=2528715 RepID=A0A4R5MAU7_9BURK|nr:hypothetical protein [Paraburkholderia silviterrae]TDG23264.1 hypothetical protein EYW47_15140 [Paraburkholderia silviterrae]
MITSERRSFHMCLDVRGALMNWHKKDFRNMFKHDDGRTMTPDEARAELLEQLSTGHNFIPFGKCDNFDHKEHGCMGHSVEKTEGGAS